MKCQGAVRIGILVCAVFSFGAAIAAPVKACTITPAVLPQGTVGTAYNSTLTANGCSVADWSVQNGALPLGLTLSSSGTLSGTPALAGPYFSTNQGKDSSGGIIVVSQAFVITIIPSPPASLAVSASSMSFDATADGSNPAAQSLLVTNSGGGVLTWSASDGAFWLSASPTSGSAPATLSASVSITGLGAGTYSDTLIFTAPGAQNSPLAIPVTLNVSPVVVVQPFLSVSPASLVFAAEAGGANPAAQSLGISNTGGGTITWSAVSSQAGLGVSPASGTAPSSASVSISISGLIAGTYSGAVTIAASGAQGSPQTIPVSLTVAAPAPTPPTSSGVPSIFFTDLLSGPNSGGQNTDGTILTIYGIRFGSTQGTSTVSVGGGAAAKYLTWSDTKISIALGAAAATGNVVVHAPSGDSNPAHFTVRAGNIFFVATIGNDSNPGTFASPWKTLVKAKNTMHAGDITYAMDGVSQQGQDNYTAVLSVTSAEGTAASPIALIAYPGATVTIGTTGSGLEAIRIPNVSVTADYWVIAGMRLIADTSAIDLGGGVNPSTGWRIVGNYISCPNGNGQTGCVSASRQSNVYFLGNEVTNTGVAGGSKQYHAVYFTTDTNHVWCAWNHIHDNNTCRAIQFHSSPLCYPSCGAIDTTGFDQYDLHVHDNLIHGDACDGINFATVDPSKGTVEAYNNVIYHVGAGPAPPDGEANYAGIYSPGYTNNGAKGKGAIAVYNNTFYDNGSHAASWGGNAALGSFDSGAGLFIQAQNNIIYQPSGEPYIEAGSNEQGDHNLFFGNGAPPLGFSNSLNANPMFVNLPAFNFQLQPGSPAIDAGLATLATADLSGVPRPQGNAYDLGAFEFIF